MRTFLVVITSSVCAILAFGCSLQIATGDTTSVQNFVSIVTNTGGNRVEGSKSIGTDSIGLIMGQTILGTTTTKISIVTKSNGSSTTNFFATSTFAKGTNILATSTKIDGTVGKRTSIVRSSQKNSTTTKMLIGVRDHSRVLGKGIQASSTKNGSRDTEMGLLSKTSSEGNLHNWNRLMALVDRIFGHVSAFRFYR